MRFGLSKAVILLSVWMLMTNAQCYARCLVQPCCKKASMPCHSSGKKASADCSHHGDLGLSAASWHPALDAGIVFAGDVPACGLPDPFCEYHPNSDSSPPWSDPLRSDLQLRV
jgi:hypothetical protein